MENVRILELPKCKMVASQCAMFGEGPLEAFDSWFSTLKREMFPRDFLGFDGEPGRICVVLSVSGGDGRPEGLRGGGL